MSFKCFDSTPFSCSRKKIIYFSVVNLATSPHGFSFLRIEPKSLDVSVIDNKMKRNKNIYIFWILLIRQWTINQCTSLIWMVTYVDKKTLLVCTDQSRFNKSFKGLLSPWMRGSVNKWLLFLTIYVTKPTRLLRIGKVESVYKRFFKTNNYCIICFFISNFISILIFFGKSIHKNIILHRSYTNCFGLYWVICRNCCFLDYISLLPICQYLI